MVSRRSCRRRRPAPIFLGWKRPALAFTDGSYFHSAPRNSATPQSLIGGEEWGGRYDNILDQLKAPGDLVVLNFSPGDDAAYVGTNGVILDEAERLAQSWHELVEVRNRMERAISRGRATLQQHFREEAGRRGLRIQEISTL